MRAYLIALALFALAGCTSPGDRYPPYFEVDDVKQLELYSLAPRGKDDSEPKQTQETFHGWRVLGKTTIPDSRLQSKISRKLTEGLESQHGGRAACFEPHHGLRIVTDEGTTDMVICFMCDQVNIYHPDGRFEDLLMSYAPMEVLDQVLKENKVPPYNKRHP